MTTRAARRAQARNLAPGEVPSAQPRRGSGQPDKTKPGALRVLAFVVVAVVLLGAGVYMAGNTFFTSHDVSTPTGAIAVSSGMDGFTPKTLDAKPGQTLTLVWSNKDDAAMLTNGVHTLVSDSLKVRLEDPAESTVTVTLAAPMTPGDYDFWCDSCCGGKDTPAMHGTLHVEA
jgi:cytochrome c oxidase subunit II